jgi:hypothetical protein
MPPNVDPATVVNGSGYVAAGPKCSDQLDNYDMVFTLRNNVKNGSISSNNNEQNVPGTATVINGSGDAATGPKCSSDIEQNLCQEVDLSQEIICEQVDTSAATVANGSLHTPSAATGPNCSGQAKNYVIDTTTADHDCCLNYQGSSGGMESDGILQLCLEINKQSNGEIFFETIVADDDNKLKKYLTHAYYKRQGGNNHGGSLPSNIPEPKWFADPNHRAKCVAGMVFDLTKAVFHPWITNRM